MSKKTSAGILLRVDDKYLIAHPTGQDQTSWSIPKGQVNADETIREAAFREFYEETGLDLRTLKDVKVSEKPFAKYKTKKGKIVHIFLAETSNKSLLTYPFKCISFFGEGQTPEMDDYKWIKAEEALNYILPSQLIIFQSILHSK